jgi:hypothetical protein
LRHALDWFGDASVDTTRSRSSEVREAEMKASVFYRIAAALLVLFAVAHTLGFQQADPSWGADAVLGSMRSVHFDAMGFNRTYWDFFLASGFTVGALYLFAAILAWQLGGLPEESLAIMRVTAWGFALCFAVIAYLSWRHLFIIPVVFSVVITLCLIAAAALSLAAKSKNQTHPN